MRKSSFNRHILYIAAILGCAGCHSDAQDYEGWIKYDRQACFGTGGIAFNSGKGDRPKSYCTCPTRDDSDTDGNPALTDIECYASWICDTKDRTCRECFDNESKCEDGQIAVCVNGKWEKAPCDDGDVCPDGGKYCQSQNPCTATCSNGTYEKQCKGDDNSYIKINCNYGCDYDHCLECLGIVKATCDGDGKNLNVECQNGVSGKIECADKCKGNQCVSNDSEICELNETRCHQIGNSKEYIQQQCMGNNRWSAGVQCDNGGNGCSPDAKTCACTENAKKSECTLDNNHMIVYQCIEKMWQSEVQPCENCTPNKDGVSCDSPANCPNGSNADGSCKCPDDCDNGCDENGCFECQKDDQCKSQTNKPFCDTESHKCVECLDGYYRCNGEPETTAPVIEKCVNQQWIHGCNDPLAPELWNSCENDTGPCLSCFPQTKPGTRLEAFCQTYVDPVQCATFAGTIKDIPGDSLDCRLSFDSTTFELSYAQEDDPACSSKFDMLLQGDEDLNIEIETENNCIPVTGCYRYSSPTGGPHVTILQDNDSYKLQSCGTQCVNGECEPAIAQQYRCVKGESNAPKFGVLQYESGEYVEPDNLEASDKCIQTSKNHYVCQLPNETESIYESLDDACDYTQSCHGVNGICFNHQIYVCAENQLKECDVCENADWTRTDPKQCAGEPVVQYSCTGSNVLYKGDSEAPQFDDIAPKYCAIYDKRFICTTNKATDTSTPQELCACEPGNYYCYGNWIYFCHDDKKLEHYNISCQACKNETSSLLKDYGSYNNCFTPTPGDDKCPYQDNFKCHNTASYRCNNQNTRKPSVGSYNNILGFEPLTDNSDGYFIQFTECGNSDNNLNGIQCKSAVCESDKYSEICSKPALSYEDFSKLIRQDISASDYSFKLIILRGCTNIDKVPFQSSNKQYYIYSIPEDIGSNVQHQIWKNGNDMVITGKGHT